MQHLTELSAMNWTLKCFAIQKLPLSVQSSTQWPVLNYNVQATENTTCVEVRKEKILLYLLFSVSTATDYEQDCACLLHND